MACGNSELVAVDIERSALTKGAFGKRNSQSMSIVEWLRVLCLHKTELGFLSCVGHDTWKSVLEPLPGETDI